MEFILTDAFDLIVLDEQDNKVATLDKLQKSKLVYDYDENVYHFTATNAFYNSDIIKFISGDSYLENDKEDTYISVKGNKGKRCKLIAKSIGVDKDNKQKYIEINMDKCATYTMPSFSGNCAKKPAGQTLQLSLIHI